MKYLAIVMLVVASCSEQKTKEAAIGLPGKINIVINPDLWNGQVGKTLDSLLGQEMTVLPRPETIFKVKQVNPEGVNPSMKRTRNLIFVITLDDNSEHGEKLKRMVTQETLDQIQTDTAVFMSALSNVFALNQEVVYLMAPTREVLLQKIRKHAQRIVGHFDSRERQRLEKGMLNVTTTKGLTDQLQREHGFALKIPYGYRLADNQKDFVWLRQINSLDDKDIFVAWKQYDSPADFKKEKLVQFRDQICGKYLYEDPEDPDTFLITETTVDEKPVETKEINWNGLYAVEVKGLWRTNVKTMGGPFLGYAFVDEKRGRLYYIEGFTYSPSKDQREIMRELEAILWGFKLI